MAFAGKPKSEEQYGRLMGMIAPEATPSKRVGTEAPVGSVAAGPKAGQAASEFTKAGQAPGAAFGRQLKGANIGGITRLAEQPLLRESGQEATRVAQEGIGYKTGQKQSLAQQPQFTFGEKETPDIVKKLGEGEAGATETAQQILSRSEIPVPEFQAGDIKEFTPLQALRGGSVESLLRKEAAGPYSTGMAGLDALLFQKKGGAQALANKGIALRATEQAAADALEKKLTEEARKEAGELVESQKTKLRGGIETGLKGREEAYTKAPEGQQSKLQQAQAKLQQDYAEAYGKTAQERQQFINTQVEATKAKALEDMISKLRSESIAAQESAGSSVQGDVTIKIPSRAELLQAAQNDPRYQHAIRNIDLQSPYAQQRGLMQQGAVPTLELANVISPEDAQAYSRLQALIGGKEMKPTAAQFTPGAYDRQDLENFFSELRSRSFI